MSDLFDPLRELTREPTTPLPPFEVRRRGDRHRRHRQVVLGAAAAAAVAVVTVGAVAVTDRSPSSSQEIPPATQSPSATPTGSPTPSGRVTHVPEGFPLDQDMIRGEESHGPSRSALFLAETTLCGGVTPYSPAEVPTDAVGVSHLGVEYSQNRELSVYPDAASAGRAADDLVGTFRSCPTYVTDTGDTGTGTATNDVTTRDLGDQAWAVKNGYTFNGAPAIGQDIYLVVRVGNAVLVSRTGGEGPGNTNPQAFEDAAQGDLDGLRATVAAMCLFSQAGCGDATDTTETVAPATFGPDGYGDLRLYLTPEEVDDTGQATAGGTTPSGLSCTQLTYTGHSKDQVDGFISTLGVVVLFAPGGVKTPEGLGVGSPESDITRLYPDIDKQVSGYRIPLDGGKQYFATVQDGAIVELSLESAGQTCIR